MCIRDRPGGFAGLFRERADLFFERFIGLEEVWPGTSLTDRLCEVPTPVEKLRTLEVFLTGRLHPGARRSELVDQAMHLFRETDFRVADCARSIGVSAVSYTHLKWLLELGTDRTR